MSRPKKVCSFPECECPVLALGLCSAHYQQLKKGKELRPIQRFQKFSSCQFPGCPDAVYEYGLCRGHYAQKILGQELRPKRKLIRVKECLFDSCGEKPFRRGLCRAHFEQQRRGLGLRPIRSYGANGCSFPGCGKPHDSGGYCRGHSQQFKRNGTVKPIQPRREICSMSGCGRPHSARGLCSRHYAQFRRRTDLEYKLRANLGSRISRAVRKLKKSNSTMMLVGCSLQELKAHIESLFTEGMSWEKLLAGEIHLDHIMPCAMFNLVDPAQQAECFHYTNLQPLWAKDNLMKHDKSPEEWARVSEGAIT